MEGNESVLSSYYHHHHHHHHNSHATTTTASNPTTTNGMFTNTQNHNPHVSSPHYTSSEPSPLIFSPHSVTGRGGGGGGGGGGGVLPSSAAASETVKRKRGRPRKYGPPETHSLAKSISSPPHKKNPYTSSSLTSSSKKSQLLALGNAGQGFTPHVITVGAGEDVAQKILSFVQQRKCAVCILSASGSISNASLRQPAMLGGNVTYEGRFEILSLSGSFLHSEIGGASSRTGGISVCLARTDGHIIGGGVGGPLQAAGPVQVIAGSFFFDTSTDAIADEKIEASVDKPPPQVVGASITSVTFRSAPDFPGRISVGERDDHQNIGGNFVLQPQGMDLTSSHLTDWRNGFDVGSGDDIEYDGTDHGECPSPEDGDDEQLDC